MCSWYLDDTIQESCRRRSFGIEWPAKEVVFQMCHNRLKWGSQVTWLFPVEEKVENFWENFLPPRHQLVIMSYLFFQSDLFIFCMYLQTGKIELQGMCILVWIRALCWFLKIAFYSHTWRKFLYVTRKFDVKHLCSLKTRGRSKPFFYSKFPCCINNYCERSLDKSANNPHLSVIDFSIWLNFKNLFRLCKY